MGGCAWHGNLPYIYIYPSVMDTCVRSALKETNKSSWGIGCEVEDRVVMVGMREGNVGVVVITSYVVYIYEAGRKLNYY